LFRIITTEGRARRGEFTCPHGTFQTPVFMNVGTQGAIKGGVAAHELRELGCQIALSNTYHLHVRPGDELIKRRGGLHRFMNWDGPILTDSGGFQIFSLAGLRKIKEAGVTFHSHVDGRKIFMGPEESVRIQAKLGSDIAMALDECIEIPAPYDYVDASCGRTYRWLVRCKAELDRLNALPDAVNPGQVLFGINQGATFPELRVRHMKQIAELDLAGYAIGGLAVGESHSEMYDTIALVEEYMPKDRPRYLMGVGTPSNIIAAVARGVDLFDCVMPARNGRHGHLNTWDGILNINNAGYAEDDGPISPDCGCPVCRRYSRAYIRHLFRSGELLGLRFGVMHNLYFYNSLLARIRHALENGTFSDFRKEYARKLGTRI
jgi:queuine tRNA-ribosyltransferase